MHSWNKSHIRQALGKEKADLVLRNCRLVNVLSGEIEEGVDIAVCDREIVGIGPGYEAEREIDVAGRYVYPGLIDAHIHLESTKLRASEAGRLMAQHGTAAVITDPHEIGNVAALDGIGWQMDSCANNGYIHVWFVAPSCVPALPDAAIESAPSCLDPAKLRMIAESPCIVGLGELMNVPGILLEDPLVLEKIADFRRRKLVVDGHAPMLSGHALNACIYAGVQSDHESTSLPEAREKLRRGMYLMIREGSSERNLDALLPLVTEKNASRIMFASDDLDPSDLQERGHIDHLLRRAVTQGLDPICALQMATLTPAIYFGLQDRLGAIFPGALADLVISPDLQEFRPDLVLHEGKIVFENGKIQDIPTIPGFPLHPTMNVRLPSIESLRVPAIPNRPIRLIELVPGQILTREVQECPKIGDGAILCDPERDIAKVCVFERHRGSGAFGLGFVRGLGIQRGAIGSSVGHDSHNLIVVGMTDADILHCAQMIRDMGGGQAAVFGESSEKLPLPIAGLISDDTAENVIAAERSLDAFCTNFLGISLHRPMAALSFMALPVIPELRITDQGLFSIAPGGYPQKVSIFL